MHGLHSDHLVVVAPILEERGEFALSVVGTPKKTEIFRSRSGKWK